jgi:hypothetical protein
MLLVWCRDAQNTWQSELAQGQAPQPARGATVDLAPALGGASPRSASAYDPWEDRRTDLRLNGTRATLPDFSRSLVVKVSLQGTK